MRSITTITLCDICGEEAKETVTTVKTRHEMEMREQPQMWTTYGGSYYDVYPERRPKYKIVIDSPDKFVNELYWKITGDIDCCESCREAILQEIRLLRTSVEKMKRVVRE